MCLRLKWRVYASEGKLTRKDYVAIADVLRAGMSTTKEKTPAQVLSDHHILACAERIADVFQRDNPRFDRKRFMEAVRGKRGRNG